MSDLTVMAEVPDLAFLTGNFEVDFNESCKRLDHASKAPVLVKIKHPLPPLPMSKFRSLASQSKPSSQVDMRISTDDHSFHQQQPLLTPPGLGAGGLVSAGMDRPSTTAQSLSLPQTAISVRSSSAIQQPPPPSQPAPAPNTSITNDSASYKSKYKFRPCICLETGAEGEYDDEVFKVEVRGWKLALKSMECLATVLPACVSVTQLVLWNCGMEEAHFSLLLSTILSCNVRLLSLDQNPGIPERLFSYLISEESTIKNLSLRMNNIGDVGAKLIGTALKGNRTLHSLNLWKNHIGKDGAVEIAEGLKFNSTLTFLSLGNNNIKDEGAIALAKALSNYALSHDELLTRRKMLAEIERQRKEQDEDPIVKRAKGRINTAHARNSSASTKKLDEMNTKKDAPEQKGGKKGGPPPKAAAGKKVDSQAAAKKPETPSAPAAGKKGAAGAAAADDKKGGKDKKGAAAPAAGKGGKKGKVEEAKDEAEEAAETAGTVEPMFERNGQWVLLGNRALSCLNLSQNELSEEVLKAFLECFQEQESTADHNTEGLPGLFRLGLQGNCIEKESGIQSQLQNMLNSRNPHFEHVEHEGAKTRKEDDEAEEGLGRVEEDEN